MATKQVYGRWGMECGCDFHQGVYRKCLLCLAPKRPGAFHTDDECNAIFNASPKAERERLMALIVRRIQQRTCPDIEARRESQRQAVASR